MKKVILTTMILATMLLPSESFGQSAFDLIYGDDEKYKDVVVEKVIASDLIILKNNEREKVRLIGLKAPEPPPRKKDERPEEGEMGFIMERPNAHVSPVTPVEQEAFDFVKDLLEDQRVRLEFDSYKTDEKGRTLAYVYLINKEEDDLFVNEKILEEGFANLSIQPPNTKHSKTLRKAYRKAREERKGLQNR